MIKKNFIRDKLYDGQSVVGTWAIIPSVVHADIITSTGLDFVIIDREHGPISFETAQQMAMACVSNGASPIMRVGDIDKAAIQNVLDIGMHGVQIPNIENAAHANEVIDYSKFPPLGSRGFSPFTRAGGFSMQNASTLMQTANDNTLVILNVEGLEAVNAIDDILSIPGVDVIFVGLFDLSKALGIPGDVDNPILIDTLQNIVEKASRRDKFVGTISTNSERLCSFREMGVKYMVHSVDCEVLHSAYSSVAAKFRDTK